MGGTKNRRIASLVAFLLFSIGLAARAATVIPKTTDVVVVGAGLAGLGTAYELKKAGVSYHVLELTPRVGGRVKTVRYERAGHSVSADSGMEEYWESNPAARILKELKLPTRSDVALSSIVLQGKLFALGNETAAEFEKKVFSDEETKALTAFKKELAPIVSELKSGKAVRPELMVLKDKSFADFVIDKGLPPKAAEWVRVSIECEIGTGWDRISALDGIAEFHIFVEGGEKSVRVIGGNDKFTDALARSVGESHVSVNKRVTAIRTVGDKVTVTYLDLPTNKSGTIVASHVVSTIPLFRLFEMQFDPPLSDKKQEAIRSQGWGSYFKAHVFVPQTAERFWKKDGASMLPILSDSELGVIYDGNPDDSGKTRIISLLIVADTAERFNLMPLDAVRGEIRAAFEKLWPGFSKEIQDMEFYRYHPRAIGAWPVGRSRFDALSNAVREPENRVYLAGDFTESSHSDGAFISAERVVRQIKEAKSARALASPVRKASLNLKRGRR